MLLSLCNFSIYDQFKRWFVFLLCSLISSICFSTEDQQSQNPPVKIFINQSVPDKQYSLADVRAIFAMRKTRWHDGKKVQVFVLPDNNPLHRELTKSKLKMFPHQLRRIWDRLIFSGVGHGPNEVESFEEMRKKIETVPGAIGYLLTPVNSKKIKVLNYE